MEEAQGFDSASALAAALRALPRLSPLESRLLERVERGDKSLLAECRAIGLLSHTPTTRPLEERRTPPQPVCPRHADAAGRNDSARSPRTYVRGRAATSSLSTPRSPRAEGRPAFPRLSLEGARSLPGPPTTRPLSSRTPTELRAAGCVLETGVASEAGIGADDAAQTWLDGLDGYSQLVPVLTQNYLDYVAERTPAESSGGQLLAAASE